MIKFNRIEQYKYNNYVTWKGGGQFCRQQWLERATQLKEYFHNNVDNTNTVYTKDQLRKLDELLGMPVNVNLLYPMLSQKIALLASVKPSFKIVTTDGKAKDYAFILDKIKHGILYASDTSTETEAVLKDAVVAGMGAWFVSPDTFFDRNPFHISISYIPYENYILDPNARKRNLEDMEGCFIEKAVPYRAFVKLYADILAQLTDENGQPIDPKIFINNSLIEGQIPESQKVVTTAFADQQSVIVREYYEKVFSTMYTVQNPVDGTTSYVFAENLSEEQRLLLDPIKEYPDTYVRKTILFGEFEVWEEILPITNYPLVVTFFEWGGRPYASYGAGHFMMGMQEVFDKILAIMVLNGILSNNPGWTAPVGSILPEHRKAWEEYGNDPRVIREYVPKEYGNTVLKPEREQVAQLSNFYPLVLDILKQGMQTSTAITPILQGDASEAGVDVFSSLQQYQSAAMVRIQNNSARLNDSLKLLGQVLIEYLVATIQPDTYQFLDEKGRINEVSVMKDFINNMRLFRYKVAVVPDAASPTKRLATSMELFRVAQSSSDPVERSLYTQKAAELTDIPEIDDLLKKLDVTKRTQSELQSLQEAYNRLMETSKQIENRFINTELENRIMKKLMNYDSKIEREMGAITAKLGLAKELATDKLDEAVKPETNNTNEE